MKDSIKIFLADPVEGGPKAPPGVDQGSINSIWTYWLWGIAIVGTFALAGCALLAWKNSHNNEGNEGVTRAAKIIGALIAVGLVPGIVGTVTGL